MEDAISTESVNPLEILKQQRDEAREAIFSGVRLEKLSKGNTLLLIYQDSWVLKMKLI